MKDNNLYVYTYKWILNLLIPELKEPFKINVIKEISQIVSPNDSIFTEYRVTCLLENVMLNLLKKNRNTCQIEATLIEYKYSAGEGEPLGNESNVSYSTKSYEKVEENDLFSDVFVPFFDENSFPNSILDAEFSSTVDDFLTNTESDDKNIYTSNDIEVGLTTINFTMYHKNSILLNKRMINEIYDNVDVASVLLDQINQTNIDNVIIDEPDNTATYTNILIPPYNLKHAINFIQIQYGIYKRGLLFFIDRNTMYILDRFKNNHEFEEGDFPSTTILITDIKNTTANPSFITINDDGSLEYSVTAVPNKIDNSILSGETEGDVFVFSNIGLGMISMEYDGDNIKNFKQPIEVFTRSNPSHSESGKKISMIYDNINNTYNLSSKIYGRCIHNIVGYTFSGVAYDSFKPNKTINLVFHNEERNNEFGGDKFLLSYRLIFKTNPEYLFSQEFSCTALVQVADTKDIDSIDESGVTYNAIDSSNSISNDLFNIGKNFSPSNFVTTGELFVDNTAFPEIKEELGAIRINIADNNPYYTQRNNERSPLVTCNVTSFAMALHYAKIPLNSPSDKQPEDWLDERLVDTQYDYIWNDLVNENKWMQGYPRREIHAYIPKVINKLYNKEVVRFTNLSIKDIVFQIAVLNKPVIVSGNYSYCGIPGHISVITGIITNQHDIKDIYSSNQVDLNKLVKFEFNDPFGDPNSNYKIKDGELIEMSLAKFDAIIKPERNINNKMVHIFV